MADSDYEFEGDDGSEDEYVASRDSSTSRAQAAGRRKAQPKVAERKAHAWARRGSTPPEDEYDSPIGEEEEEEEILPQKSLQHMEEDRKRKRYG
jgi:transcription initiation factor TFIIH subunit 2